MIIPNGYIAPLTVCASCVKANSTQREGDDYLDPLFDADGFPIINDLEEEEKQAETHREVEGEAIRAQIIARKLDYLATSQSGADHTAVTYEVILEAHEALTAPRVRLYDRDKQPLGDFSVISSEYLRAVGEIRLFV